MKKLLAIALIVMLCCSCFITVLADEDDDSIVNSANSGFENVTSIEQTDWFRLIDSLGDSKQKDLTDMTIKTDGGATGSNYLSMTGNKSWFSPSINLYPFFKEAGPGEYVITFFFRCKQKTPSSFMIRGLKSDMDEEANADEINGFPSLIDKGQSNYFRSFSCTLIDNGGWFFLESDYLDVTEENLKDEHHNWWFVLGTMVNSQFTVDIDDFKITPVDDYVSPNAIKETNVTYLNKDVIENAFDAVIPLKTDAPAASAPAQTNEPTTTPVIEKTDVTLYVCIGIGTLAVLVAVPVLVIKKKKK